MKRFRSAVVFGKFWPLHTGHLRLISEAIAASEQVSVVVDDGDEDVPADVRVTWLVEAFPTATVITAPDLCGHDTSDCTPSCSARYAEWLTAARVHVEAVFSGEPYGDLLASCLGAVSVRLGREKPSEAGREIRADLVGHWEMLSAPARLVLPASRHRGRRVDRDDHACHRPRGGVLEPSGFPSTADSSPRSTASNTCGEAETSRASRVHQATLEDEAARCSGPVLVCDTDVLATAVWHQRYVGGRCEVVEEMASERRPCLYALTSDDIAFTQDGLRDGEHLRGWMTQRFRERLAGSGVAWLETQGDRRERVKQVVESISEQLGPRWALEPRKV